jgi:hypothetical protein
LEYTSEKIDDEILVVPDDEDTEEDVYNEFVGFDSIMEILGININLTNLIHPQFWIFVIFFINNKLKINKYTFEFDQFLVK